MLKGTDLQGCCALQYWKSNAMFWCDYCKVWMQDKPAARATHEKGIKHKDNVARSACPSPASSASTDYAQPLTLAC